jgi:alpha-N-arabinofuranosidase
MFRKAFALTTAAVLTLGATSLGAQAPAAQLAIHAGQPVSTVSPTLYGLMTEEINFSYDGGLYAEMIRNRTFRSTWEGVPYWYVIENGESSAKIEVDEKDGPSDALKTSLKLTVDKASKGNEAGLLNVGYWGFGLKQGSLYKGSFYARTLKAGLGPITISLIQNDNGRVLATTKVKSVSAQWQQYKFELKTAELKAGAGFHLAVTVANPGELKLQLFSLFPPTYNNRPGGFRTDLMEKMAAMHPAFLRFPGGNYLEGNHISERFDWKKMIGPMVDRPTHPSPWNYWSDDGMGLLEFLEWCEDLDMQPVLAVYAGYSMAPELVKPGPDLEPYVQDALDEIEYVTGGPETKWGAQRVKDGHARPFKLHYVEIGNEDFFDKSGSYEGRYAQFSKAIKAKYPELELIATAPLKETKADVQDDHFYVRATGNFHDAAHYDKADRKGPKIFVGEWATREGIPTPNLAAALGDAAWMTGLERNSDLVVMAAYAPLLVNVNPGGMQWETDLIGFNASKSYGSPAYYAQVMFGSYLGDHTLASKLEGGGSKFFYSVTRNTAKKQIYLKLVNGSSAAQNVEIALDGTKPAPKAKLVTLKGETSQATNSIDDPERVVPVESTIELTGPRIRHTMPPYSIQVLCIEEQ